MQTRTLAIVAIMSLVLLTLTSMVSAAVITWGPVYNASASIILNGSTGDFNTFVDSSTFWSSDLTINGVKFNHYDHIHYPGDSGGAPFSYGFSNGSQITIDGSGTWGVGGYADTPQNDFERLTNKVGYVASSNKYAIVLGGLEVGRPYQVQLFGPDWNVNYHTFIFGDEAGNKTATMHTGGDWTGHPQYPLYFGPPQYVVGTFVADAISQRIYMGGDASYSYAFAPAISLFTVPEPATLIVWSLLGASFIAAARWRRRKSAR